ncbi:molybdopterin-dependent oxidoreductase [Adlercreutzia sp. R7]|uniref:Molybdopterin-dependent oxidoreductase n=1 Tax=Adlercreutzia wanghongyangiae TaxID=3111451 RepID=A0ABU6IK12_9ACTN|nr:molybdopterin-dependent oxidoreductase [Adlercreutzia sp. R7]
MTTSEKKLTRRSFLATTALTAGAMASAGMAGCSSVSTDEAPELSETGEAEETYAINFCRGNCGGTCPQKAIVREGKLVKCTPVAAELDRDYRISQSGVGCVKGRATPQRVYATHRVTHPMRQTGERGSDNWEQISWDEAISLIAENFQAAIDECGGSSIAFWKGFGNGNGYLNGAGSSMMCNPYIVPSTSIGFSRFIQKIGATVFEASSDFAAMYSTFITLNIPINGNEDLVNAKTILSIGLNPADTARGDWPIVEARRKGATVVTMDPVFSKSAAHSDIWVPVRPGTDGAMLLAMCNYIIDNDLVDYDYLRNGSVAPLLIKDDLSYLKLSDLGLDPVVVTEGEDPVDTEVVWDAAAQSFGSSFAVKDPELEGTFDANGISVRTVYSLVKEGIKQFTVDFAAAECDVPAEQIEEVARLYATNKPSTLAPGYGYEHYKNSWHMYKTLMLLASLTGNVGKPGASIIQFGATSSISRYAATNTEDSVVEGALPVSGITGEYLPQLLETETWNNEAHPIRCIYVLTADPLSNGLGRSELIEAFKKVKFVVTADSFMTDTARYSDLVLPVALSWETDDSSASMFTQKAVEPLGECRQDIDIFRAIAGAMDFADLYPKTNEEYLRSYLDTEENLAAGCGYDVASEQGIVGDGPQFAAGVSPETNPTGRTQFFLSYLLTRDAVDWQPREVDHYPWYEPAHEAYQDNPLRETYPLYGVSSHHHYWAHSLFKGIPWLDELRGEPTVLVHEDTAAQRGIETGDTVRVFNDHGYVVLKAIVTQGIRPDTLMLPHGPEGDDFIDGHTQALSSVVLDEMTSNNNFNDFVCEIEKYQGGAE